MPDDTTVERALFASAYGALQFALNFEDDSIPGPVMNRAMAETKLERAKAEAQMRSYTGGGTGGGGRRSSPVAKHVPLGKASDRAILAGWILQRFLHLDVVPRLVLTLTVMKRSTPCACGSPCCRGWVLKRQWVESVRILTEHIKDWAVLDQESGKRGYSTEPRLRQALVEDFAKPPDKRASLATLAELTDVTIRTVATHRVKIHEYLASVQDKAWEDLAAIFDAHGITGQIEN